MFCPVGYVSLVEVCGLIRDAVYYGLVQKKINIRAVASRNGSKNPEEYPENFDPDKSLRDCRIIEGWEEAATVNFIRGQGRNFYITPPNGSGHILKLSKEVMEWSATFWELPGGGDRSGFLYRPSVDGGPLHRAPRAKGSSDGFYFFDLEEGVIDVSSDDRASRREGDGDDLVRRAEIIKDIDGWIVCWKLPDREMDDKYLIELAFGREDNHESRPRRRGPASERHLALAAYRKLYPDGHEGIDTWAQVVARTGYSEATIRRALTE